MTMPTIERTYEVSPNHRTSASGTALTDNRATLLAIVNQWLAWGTNPMTVVRSSNGTTAGAANHWSTGADLVWHASGSPFSWIVLVDPSGFSVLIALDATSADGHLASVYLSSGAGFTGGTTTARATATDEVALVSQAPWGGVTVSTADSVVHLTHEAGGSSGGLSVVIVSAGAPIGFWHFSRVKDPLAAIGAYPGWTPAFFGVVQSGSGIMTLATLYQANPVQCKITGAGLCSLFMTCESCNGTTLAAQPFNDDQTHEYTLAPIGLFSTDPGFRGRKGSVFDLWWGETVNQTGDSYPGDGSLQLVQFGHLVFPWSAAAPQIV